MVKQKKTTKATKTTRKKKKTTPAKINPNIVTQKLLNLKQGLIDFSSRQLTDGDDLESVAKAVALLREIENIQNKSLTYDQAFLLLQNFRHGLNEDITKEEIEELRATFGSELDEE